LCVSYAPDNLGRSAEPLSVGTGGSWKSMRQCLIAKVHPHKMIYSITDTPVSVGVAKWERGAGSKRDDWSVVSESLDVQVASLQCALFSRSWRFR